MKILGCIVQSNSQKQDFELLRHVQVYLIQHGKLWATDDTKNKYEDKVLIHSSRRATCTLNVVIR